VSAPATANQVVANLSALTEELRRTVSSFRIAERDAAEKRHAADMVESRAFLSADGAMDLRKHIARVAADRAENDALVAEALVRVLRAEIRSIETRIEVGRTYGATVRAELKTIGYGSES
jgi:uncharacterized protein YutE (UPF0331/DUF86 family)